jgi:predicted transposase YbfD/YdcC
LLAARLVILDLPSLPDPRHARGKRWSLDTLLTAVFAGLLAGKRSLADTEDLTDEMSVAARRWLRLPGRVPDSTLRALLCRLPLDPLRSLLHRLSHHAHRAKSLVPVGLPFGVVAVDGKSTALSCPEGLYAQRQSEGHLTVVRTFTCTLVSAAAKPCLDALPIPAKTNEMGHFPAVLRQLNEVYGKTNLFRLISADSGSCSAANAALVVAAKRDYLLAVKDNQPSLLAEMQRLLGARTDPDATSDDARGRGSWIRRVYVSDEMAGWPGWEHLGTVVRIESEVLDKKGQRLSYENRFYVSSLARRELTAEQWLLVVRRHWGVENETHHTLDTAFAEDDHPWIEANENGMLAVALLRRVAFTMAAIFRGVTQRSEERRAVPWKTLLRWFSNAWIGATAEMLSGLRRREGGSMG